MYSPEVSVSSTIGNTHYTETFLTQLTSNKNIVFKE